jgi:acetyl esterase/lipase
METDGVMSLLDEIISLYPVDEKRVYLTGLSMGGYGAWDLAMKNPERFAALATVCSGGIVEKAHVLKNLPIWAFHGAKDNIVPVQDTINMVEALKQCEGNIKLTIYPDAEHDSWTETYKNHLLYEWFLQHEINATPKSWEGKYDVVYTVVEASNIEGIGFIDKANRAYSGYVFGINVWNKVDWAKSAPTALDMGHTFLLGEKGDKVAIKRE